MSSRSALQRLFTRFTTSTSRTNIITQIPQPQARVSGSRIWATPRFSTTVKMSSIGGAGVGVGGAMYAAISTPTQRAAEPEEAGEKRHHLKGGKGFTNPWESYAAMGAFETFRTLIWRKLSGQQNTPDTTPPTVPIHTPTFHPTRETPKLRATWLGHACFLVEFPSGLRVLFDPVFEDCCAPINMKSLKRFTPPPCEIEDIPMIDVVVISHNHYDHLSYPTILRIKEKFPEAWFFAPLGNKEWFEKCGISKVTELDWWETRDVTLSRRKDGSVDVQVGGEEKTKDITATIGALPCQHVSARGPFDKCKTLWASWSVESGGEKVYFAGDTGYRTVPRSLSIAEGTDDYSPEFSHLPVCPGFAQIGKLRGPFDLGLIPIGAYEPRWLWSPVHANPKDAVNIFIDTKCKKAIGMHWGTWVLTEEEVREPPKKLKEACEWKGVEEGVFGVTGIGETKEF